MTSHLIIPDTHAHPDHPLTYFTWLGKLTRDLKPDVVVMMGDWVDMPSLCSYDKGTSGFENRRYRADVEVGIKAQEMFFKPLRQAKKRLPRFIMLEGNHEYRIKRAISCNPIQLEDVISIKDLQYEKFGWEYTPYNGSSPDITVVDNIAYAHYFISGVLGRPVSGEHSAYTLLTKQFMSCTQGHTHITDYCVRTNAEGRHIHGLVAGCHFPHFEHYAGDANNMWWRGVIFKENVREGQYDPRWISLDRIRKEYDK